MREIEEAFARAEAAAETAQRAATLTVSKAKAMVKAAKAGNIAALRKSQDELGTAASVVDVEVRAAREAWTWTPEREEAYLETDYADELRPRRRSGFVPLRTRRLPGRLPLPGAHSAW